MAFKFLAALLLSGTAMAQLRTTDFQQSLNASAPRNYIKNSGAEKNDLNVTDAGGIVSRGTSAPLEGVGSFTIDAASSTQKAIFTSDDLQPGLLGQSCEATFNYIGDASLYKAYVTLAGITVSAEVTLINSGTSSQLVSALFPCGASTSDDPAVVIEATGNGASIKVDSVYLGKALSVGTVAQAESMVRVFRNTSTQSISTIAATKIQFNGETYDTRGEFDSTTNFRYTATRPGKYKISCALQLGSFTSSDPILIYIYKNGSEYSNLRTTYAGTTAGAACPSDPVTLATGDYIEIFISTGADAAYTVNNGTNLSFMSIDRFPDTSEIVLRGNVTNVFVEAGGTPTGSLSDASATIWGTETTDTTSSYNATTGEFTAPLSGDYCWNAGVLVAGTETLDNSLSLLPYLNGTLVARYRGLVRAPGTVASLQVQSNGCTTMTVGQILTFRTNTNMTGPAFTAGTSDNYLTIRNASQGMPKPFIPGSVFAGRGSVVKVGSAVVNCTASSSISENLDTMIATVGNRSTATCAFTFTANYWSVAPVCSVSSATTAARIVAINTVTTAGGNLLSYTDAAVGDNTTINLFCVGQ